MNSFFIGPFLKVHLDEFDDEDDLLKNFSSQQIFPLNKQATVIQPDITVGKCTSLIDNTVQSNSVSLKL